MSRALSSSVFDYDCLVYMRLTLHIVKLLGLPFSRLNIDVCALYVTLDREIFVLEVIRVKNFHVVKFSLFRLICKIF